MRKHVTTAGRFFVLCGLLLWVSRASASSPGLQAALVQTLAARGASGVILDLPTGRVLARAGVERRALPGSTLKPLVLAWALREGVVTPATTVLCRRTLSVRGRRLDCTHPPGPAAYTAETALAESCNSYFASLARRMTTPQIEQALAAAGLVKEPDAGSSGPPDSDARVLRVLGLAGPRLAPVELAQAYRRLALELARGTAVEAPVARGLEGSVAYGMANPARVPGLPLLGKTGTASDPGERWTHGWFAGIVPGRLMIVLLVPHGDGGDAARLAARVLASVAAR